MKTVIFDFDGTIADSFELALDIASELTDIPHVDKDEIDRLRRLPLAKVVRELHIPLTRFPKLLLSGLQRMHERIGEVQPFKGMPEALRALYKDGYTLLVMSSNSEENVRTFLRANQLEECFAGVHGGVAVFSKASALRKILKHNHLEAGDCYYVGDETRDIVAAFKAGLKPVAVAWGYQAPEALAKHRPFALVENPPQLVSVFKSDRV